MATPRFGQDRIANVPPLNLLDALYAQGMNVDDLRPMIGMTTPEMTSYLLKNNTDRNLLDRAVNMAQGKELEAFGQADSSVKDPGERDYTKLSIALQQRGVDIGGYKGPKDANALASWAANHVNPQVIKNAVATALPGYRSIGGLAITDQDKQSVTLFSNDQTRPSTLRGIQPDNAYGVRGQTAPNAADIAAAGGNVAAATPPPAAAAKQATPAVAGGGGAVTNRNDQITVDNPATWSDDKIKAFIKANMGADAYFVDIPEVWNALKNVVQSGKGAAGLEPALEATTFWNNTKGSARAFYARQHDPTQAADVAADIAQQTQAVTKMAQTLGINIDPQRASAIAESYLRYGWTQQDLQSALAAEWHYDPSSKDQAAIVGTMKQDAKGWLVPLSDQAIQSWGASIMNGTSTEDQFKQYLRDNAKSMFPSLSALIDAHAGDPNFDVSTYADPYRQHAANILGVNIDDVDLSDPKWRRALDQIDPKTNQRRIMTLDEWDSTLKSDPQYGYDKTSGAVNSALDFAKSFASSLGF